MRISPHTLLEPLATEAIDRDERDTLTLPLDRQVLELHALARIADRLDTLTQIMGRIADHLDGGEPQ